MGTRMEASVLCFLEPGYDIMAMADLNLERLREVQASSASPWD
jgi:hypothetical protein